ncbi:MAG: methyltransferase [Erysipelotrichales bacterium]|nr:methyltransferase [Erysipelotrichales bacterium]
MKSNELNDLFDYGYSIYQNSEYFKFSIDSVLLAEFVNIKKGKTKLIDLCTGNAPVPMILHKKFESSVNITGVELQKEIYDLALKSLEYNDIKCINLINADINNIVDLFKNSKFDIITCNPPYFKNNETNYINENEIKAIARHEIKIDLESLVKIASKIIQNQGDFYLVHRPDRIADVISTLNKYNFGVKRIVPVYDDKDKNACLFLIESVFNGKNYVIIEKPVFLSDYKSYKSIFER